MSDSPRYPLPSALIHDLRTPLNQIIGYSDLLLEAAPEAEVAGDLGKIRAAGSQLLAIMDANFQAVRALDAVAAQAPSPPPITSQAPDAPRPTAPGTGRGLLLIVDDIEANRDLLGARLKVEGYDSASAENGREALEMVGAHPFDLVLLDVMMPEMDGFETLRRLKADEATRHIPVIMISAVSELESVVRCIELGAEDYLSKPFNPVLLRARVGASLERKRAHDREARLFAQLQENFGRLQALEKLRDDLTHMIIHDLRTPLTSVIVGMETVELMGELNADQREMLALALNGGATLLGMINDLLDVEKMESGAMTLDFSTIEPAELVNSALGQVASLAAGKSLLLDAHIAPDTPDFPGDEGKLRRVLVNLIGNAIKFTPANGTISVGVNRDADTVVFSVRDTGEGIPPEAFGRIFEKFGQVEGRRGGRAMSTGLGLTFCKLAVEAHGGEMSVESEIGQGSTFRFGVPIAQAQRA